MVTDYYRLPRNISKALIAIARINMVTAISNRLTELSNPPVMLAIELFTSAFVLVAYPVRFGLIFLVRFLNLVT